MVGGERAGIESRGGGAKSGGIPGTIWSPGEEGVEGALVGHDGDLETGKGWRRRVSEQWGRGQGARGEGIFCSEHECGGVTVASWELEGESLPSKVANLTNWKGLEIGRRMGREADICGES